MTWLFRISTILGWLGISASAVFLVAVAWLYQRQPDHFAAFTVMPVWMWAGCGVMAAFLSVSWFRIPWGWAVIAAWLLLIVGIADESRVLWNVRHEVAEPGPAKPHRGRPVIRVITANCDNGLPPELAVWKPDIVFLQDVSPQLAGRIARETFGRAARVHIHETNAIATRWQLVEGVPAAGQRAHRARLRMPDGRVVICVNVHLPSASTDLRFWRRRVWTEHRVNRVVRMDELRRILEWIDPVAATAPVLLAGDFNAPPDDPVYRLLGPGFSDAHREAGKSWGNTYHRRFPMLRIDRIHATRDFTPLRCATRVAGSSDHRFVVADLILTRGK